MAQLARKLKPTDSGISVRSFGKNTLSRIPKSDVSGALCKTPI